MGEPTSLVYTVFLALLGLAGLPLWWLLRNRRGVERRVLPAPPKTAGEIAHAQEEAAKAARLEREIADAELKGEVRQAGKEAEVAAEFLKDSFKL